MKSTSFGLNRMLEGIMSALLIPLQKIFRVQMLCVCSQTCLPASYLGCSERGDLHGMLPFIVGMLVAMTDHLNRNATKRILRGRVGYVHSRLLHEEAHHIC